MRGVLQLGAIGFGIALGLVVGNRLSAEAMAVVVGVVCGVLAGIPVSLMVLILTRRSSKPTSTQASAPAMPGTAYPPVVIIQPDGRSAGTHRWAPPAWDAPPMAESQPCQRSFTIVGDEDEW